jgi:hypothetical protein
MITFHSKGNISFPNIPAFFHNAWFYSFDFDSFFHVFILHILILECLWDPSVIGASLG